MMITPADIEITIQRWKRAIRPLKKADQHYARRLVQMLEESKYTDVRRFDDPLEAAMFLVLVQMVRELKRPAGDAGGGRESQQPGDTATVDPGTRENQEKG